MKILFIFFTLLYSTHLFSAEGENYFCKTVNVVKVYKSDMEDFASFDFNFKRNEKSISFGEGGYFDQTTLPIYNNAGEFFNGGEEYDMFIYNEGLFLYSSIINTDQQMDSLTIIANCKIF
tara:strand:- start:1298 stop:1657 length:360 start_codon:yes stop_codon:yes gene_type:complete